MRRRRFLAGVGLGTLVVGAGCADVAGFRRTARDPRRLAFVSAGRTCLINDDGTGLRPLEFNVFGQATWQPSAFFPDGRRVLLLSMEPRRDGPGRPFAEYYTQTPTHLWIHDLETGALTEIATRERRSVFYTPELLLPDGRLLVQVVRDRVGQILNMNLDGTDAREFTRPGEGLPYGTCPSPDGTRVAYHLASPAGYQIWTSDLEGRDRRLIAGDSEHLFFGPRWSPDGMWLAYMDCRYKEDPGHDWADLKISRIDGAESRSLTEGQALWFAATYGNPQSRGGGSNVVDWTRAGEILVAVREAGSKVAWEFQPAREDVDHFNRDWKPELARGGTAILRIDPSSGSRTRVTDPGKGVWDFRCCVSPDGRHVAFCRCATGEVPSLWVVNLDGTGARLLTRGLEGRGVDHPRWLPAG